VASADGVSPMVTPVPVGQRIKWNQRTFLLLFLGHVDKNVNSLFLAARAAASPSTEFVFGRRLFCGWIGL